MMRKWYVFDQFDCFDKFDTAEKAAEYATSMVDGKEEDNYEGVHIAYLTEAEMREYCATGQFPFNK
jgi:hypothetical protein